MLQGLVNKTLDEKLNTVKFEDHLFRKIEEATPLCRYLKKVAQAMMEEQEVI